MSLTIDVKELAINRGADLIGIAPIDRYETAPEEGKPQYYMSDAKSVVVIATRILQGLCDVYGPYDEEGKTIAPYMWNAYSQLNIGNSWIAIQVGKLLEDEGYRAIPFQTAGYMYRQPDKGLPDFYHKHSAVAAGLGEFGLNRLLLTPQFGAHQRLISIITNAPLDPDPMYDGPKLCRPDECGRICIKSCLHGALEDKLFTVKIGGKVFKYSTHNYSKCLYTNYAGPYMRGKTMYPAEPTDEFLEKFVADGKKTSFHDMMHPYDRRLQIAAFGPGCSACLVPCPVPWNK